MLRLLITKSYLEPHNYLTCVIRIQSARVIFFFRQNQFTWVLECGDH